MEGVCANHVCEEKTMSVRRMEMVNLLSAIVAALPLSIGGLSLPPSAAAQSVPLGSAYSSPALPVLHYRHLESDIKASLAVPRSGPTHKQRA